MENKEVKNLKNENASSFAENKEQQQEAINMAMKFGENATEEDVENVSKKMDKMKKGALAKVWDKVQELWAAFKSPDTPLSTKSIIIGSLIYMVTPIDIIPDIIPGLSNECVKRHRKRSRFKVQTAYKLSKAVSTWQRNDSHSARISRQKLHLKHYEKNLRFRKLQ